ncbi:MAG: histidinol dehydrogenase [Bacteroidia bacterium]|nr:histidinol dehydrogenase [Bacteroidia bacterium]
MKIIEQPDDMTLKAVLKRPYVKKELITADVSMILKKVQEGGDSAIIEFTNKFDGVEIKDIIVTRQEIETAIEEVPEALKMAISKSRRNIEKFHASQRVIEHKIETTPGVYCWRRSVPIEKVGIYIPGGSAPLFSTVLMLAIPARLAGCSQIVLCSPPNQEGKIHPAILYAADLIGVDLVVKAGGAQAIGALAFGTESIPKVSKIFGPGNQYVTKAKELITTQGTAIDMPAGPSEVMVIADKTANPDFVAIDLLSQAEHGPDSQVVLVATEREVANNVVKSLNTQIEALPRVSIATQAIDNSVAIITDEFKNILQIINRYAPEHLIINTENAHKIADQVVNAGSIFIGPYSAESIGDYASGTNHTLPTNGYAAMYSGVSLDSFVKKITYQEVTAQGLKNIGPVVEEMAQAESLMAHKRAVTIRLQSLKKE